MVNTAMTIFSGQFNELPWLQEKTLRALQSAVSIVDIANEPDTTAWYKRKLLSHAESIIARLAPVVALLYAAESTAADSEEWQAMLEGGSFALAAWCRKFKIADPHDLGKGSLRHLRAVEEDEEKAQESDPEQVEYSPEQSADLKLQIYSSMSQRLVHEALTPDAQKLLLWMMSRLWISHPPDVVSVSKRFLPTDIGLTPEQTSTAYGELYQNGLIEKIRSASTGDVTDRLNLRLVVTGLNDSKHASEQEPETFGYPGARINGQVTSGQGTFVELPDIFSEMLARWFKESPELTELRDFLQTRIGDDKIYVEHLEPKERELGQALLVYFRYPLDADLPALESDITHLTKQWFQERLVQAQKGL
jgi:hypothetical protein